MNNQKSLLRNILIGVILILLGAGIAAIKTSRISPEDNTPRLVAGHSSAGNSIKMMIVHDKSDPTSLNKDFLVTKDTHIYVTIYRAYFQGPTVPVLTRDFTNIDKLPFLLELKGDLNEVIDGKKAYISAIVSNHIGDTFTVGDLREISPVEIPIESKNIVIPVFGICNTMSRDRCDLNVRFE